MADAFASTFWWAVGLVVVAFVVALALLPKEKPEPVDDPSDEEPANAAALAMSH
jgi:hypothetical protein